MMCMCCAWISGCLMFDALCVQMVRFFSRSGTLDMCVEADRGNKERHT